MSFEELRGCGGAGGRAVPHCALWRDYVGTNDPHCRQRSRLGRPRALSKSTVALKRDRRGRYLVSLDKATANSLSAQLIGESMSDVIITKAARKT